MKLKSRGLFAISIIFSLAVIVIVFWITFTDETIEYILSFNILFLLLAIGFRLLALGLATGVIASVVNQMGSMLGKSVFGVILFIVVFIVGHAMNLAINLLGAYVHTNRLQFVEFFGKFYEGGGKPFEPFHAETKYVDIKEEK